MLVFAFLFKASTATLTGTTVEEHKEQTTNLIGAEEELKLLLGGQVLMAGMEAKV